MKYKVLLSINGSGENGAGAVTFYRKSDAVSCCEVWSQTNTHYAYLWDGSTWTTYAPIP